MDFFKKILYPALLGIIVATIAIVNYVPGTWLTGWDNLHTEFDFPMNVYRSIFSVWEEYQGLGLLAGMAHAADLPRQVFLWATSWFIPNSFIRYFYQYLMLFVGTFGTYHILNFILKKYPQRSIFAFMGSLFYLLNLGTIQYFYVPFEPYSTFWGMFPWEICALFRFLEEPNKKNLMFLTLINILAIPQALVQTVFVVYMLVVGIILGINLWQLKTRQSIITAFKTLLIIVAVNAFWLLPSAYFTLHDVNVTKNAMNNRMNTERFFEVNKRRGTIADFAVLKEFYFDFQDIREDTNGLTFLMAPWRNHFENPLVPTIGYLFFGIILFGLLKKHPYRPYVIGLFVLSMAAFLSNTILFSEVNKLFRLLPLSSQIFRNPFTKFIVPAIFSFAVLFCFGLVFLSDYLKKKNIKQVALVGLLFLFVIYTYPLFTGNLFYKRVHVAIPQRYFDLL